MHLFLFQFSAHHTEWVTRTQKILEELITKNDQATLNLIKEAAEQEKGILFLVHLLVHSPACSLSASNYARTGARSRTIL